MPPRKLIVLFGALALSGCQQYLARQELIQPYSGDAIARNLALQMQDPWPPYVYNTHIPTSGKRQGNIQDRYTSFGEEDSKSQELQPVQLVVTNGQ